MPDLGASYSDSRKTPPKDCCLASVQISVDRETGAILTSSSAPSTDITSEGGTTSTSSTYSGNAYAFTVVNDAKFSALTASGDTAPSELVGITIPAGLTIVTDVEEATLSSGVVTFYNKS